jgi:3-hydroxyacyl-[acyl-carrier-protein] dehydratase
MSILKDFYEVENFESTEGNVSALIRINKEHSVFKGHFPNHPVMPGVCSIQIIKELTEKHLGLELMLKAARNVKFMAIINPEENELVKFDLNVETVEQNEFSVRATVFINETPALKFGGNFTKI